MGFLNDVKKSAEAEVASKPSTQTAAKTDRKAKAKERKQERAAALTKILDYLKEHKVPELEKEVELLSTKATRTSTGVTLLTTIFGSETPAKGTKITALDCFTKFRKGYPEMRKLMKKAEEKGIKIVLNSATQTYEVQ